MGVETSSNRNFLTIAIEQPKPGRISAPRRSGRGEAEGDGGDGYAREATLRGGGVIRVRGRRRVRRRGGGRTAALVCVRRRCLVSLWRRRNEREQSCVVEADAFFRLLTASLMPILRRFRPGLLGFSSFCVWPGCRRYVPNGSGSRTLPMGIDM